MYQGDWNPQLPPLRWVGVWQAHTTSHSLDILSPVKMKLRQVTGALAGQVDNDLRVESRETNLHFSHRLSYMHVHMRSQT